MNSYLEALRQELEDATRSAGAWSNAPDGKWNSSQILEHLFLTYKHTNRALAKCQEGGTPLATRPSLKHRFASFVVVDIGFLPSGRESPDRVKPRGMPPEEVRQTLLAELQQMDSALDECDRRFGARTKIIDHPFLGPLTCDQWRRFHRIHGKHHLQQLRERMR